MKGSKTSKALETTHNSSPSLATHNEAKTKGIRKRKDRSHSISKDKKVVRSNSEERIIKKNICNKSIRRVSSHEDFQKVSEEHTSKDNPNTSVQKSECNAHTDEYEWKRSGERQFRLPIYRRKHNYLRKSPKLRPVVTTKYDEKNLFYLNNNNDEEDVIKIKKDLLQTPIAEKKSISPYSSPTSSVLDLSTLHQQIDCLEPIPSSTSREVSEFTETLPSTSVACNKLLSSPRNSIITTERIYLDQYVAQSKGSPLKSALNPVEKRLNYLTKQIKRNKKKIKQYEQDFEQKHGYKPSEMEKLNDPLMNNIILDLHKLKKEYKQTKKQDKIPPTVSSVILPEEETENCTLAETLLDIEQKITAKRLLASRPTSLEEMTNTQLLEEKVDIQKGLLYLQTKHGRPNLKEDKDLVRALYDRYRNVKRMVAKTVPNNNIIELATIHEHETLHIVPNESPTSSGSTENTLDIATQEEETVSVESRLHSLSLNELVLEKNNTLEEKKKLQKTLREFENNFRTQIGRKIKKEDKEPMLHSYDAYKKAKAKLKLLDALLKKLSSPSLYST